MTTWPPVTIIIGGDGSTPPALHTAASLRHTIYDGDLQVLSAVDGEEGSPAAVANGHVGEARGDYVMMVPPGTTLDPHCIRYLVERAQSDPSLVAVALQWRSADGTVLEAGSHLHASDEITPLFQGRPLPEWLTRTPHRTQVSSQPSLLVRAQDFFISGGFNLDLDGSPYQAAHLALSLAAGGGRIEVETRAVAFAPPQARPSEADLVRGRNALQRDFSDALNQLHYQSSIDADLSVLLGNQRGTRTLWATGHLPNPAQSGLEARHLDMIEALVAGDDEVVVWATHTDGSDSGSLDARGIRWVAEPHARRWDLRHTDTRYPWLRELVRQLHWDHIVIADPALVGRLAPLIRDLSPDTAIIADLGTVRFAGAEDSETAPPADIADLDQVDGLVAATDKDAMALEHHHPDLRVFHFPALGHGEPSPPGRDGGPLFVGNLLHRPNAEAISWWIDSIAGRVEARVGRPAPLRVVGNGSDLYAVAWNHPAAVEVGGWQPDLTAELTRARVFVAPLPYPTGTGGRIATALAHGLPTVVSGPAAAMLPPELAELARVADGPDALADQVATLLTNDEVWEAVAGQLAEFDPAALRARHRANLARWVGEVTASPAVIPA